MSAPPASSLPQLTPSAHSPPAHSLADAPSRGLSQPKVHWKCVQKKHPNASLSTAAKGKSYDQVCANPHDREGFSKTCASGPVFFRAGHVISSNRAPRGKGTALVNPLCFRKSSKTPRHPPCCEGAECRTSHGRLRKRPDQKVAIWQVFQKRSCKGGMQELRLFFHRASPDPAKGGGWPVSGHRVQNSMQWQVIPN